MTLYRKWFTYFSLILVSLYIFGVYLYIHKEIEVNLFFFSPVILFILISLLMISLVFISDKFVIPTKNVFDNKKDTLKEQILYAVYQLFKEKELVKTADVVIKENTEKSFLFIFTITTPVQDSYENLTKELEDEINPALTKILGEDYSYTNEFIFLPIFLELPEPENKEMNVEQSSIENLSEPNKPI